MRWNKGFFFIFSSFFVVACGKDKSLDDFHREQANAAFAQMQAVAGTYRGTIQSQGSGDEPLPIEISLDAVMLPISNGDNTGTTAQAGLQGSVTILSGGRASGVITTASFLSRDESANGNLNGRISVPLGGSTTAAFSLNGSVNGATLSGVIQPTDRSGSPGRFTVVKDAPLPRPQRETIPGGPSELREFSGSFQDHTCDGLGRSNLCKGPGPVTVPVRMSVNAAAASSGTLFVNLFSDERLVSVQLNMDGADVPLPACAFDQRANTLRFKGLVQGTGGASSQITFQCDGRGAGYNCTYRNESFGVTYNFDVKPGR